MAIAYLGTNQIGGGGGGGSIDSIEMNGSAVPVTGGVADLGTVVTSVSDKAPLASPALTGTPTAPTAASGTNSTQIATTAFVQSAVSSTENAKSITHSDLKTARTNGTLVPGTWYRITDYVATTTDTESRSANHPFDILVMAESATTLSEEGYAALHSGDTYFSSNNLSAWKVWYCLDNDTTRFAWADSTNGKGVVYRMIDEFNNDLPFDFKGIQFKRYKITDIDIKSSGVVNPTAAIYIGVYAGLSVTANKFSVDSTDYKWFYPFTFLGSTWSSSISDASMGTECLSSQNTLLPVTSGKLQSLNNVVFARGSVLAGNAIESPYEAAAAMHNCEFGKGATHLSIFGHAANNVMRSQFRKSIILGHFRHNTFNSDVQNNEFCSQEDISFNEMSDCCAGNSIIVGSGTVYGNRIASYFNSNVIVCSDFSYNTTSSVFTRNTILGTNVQGNTFGVVYDSSFSGILRFSLTSGYMKYCSFSYVTGCQMLGNIQYVTAEAGTSSNYFSGIVIKGPLNGASNAVIKLENSNFLLGSSATIGRSVVIESNPDGEIVATWRDADGKETGIIATAAGSRSNTWNALPSPAGGTVTSVAMTVPTGFSVSGTPVTSSGTLAVTLDSQAKNKVLASPTNASGTPSFRALDASDIPDLSGTYKTTDANVTQTATTTNSNYEVLFSGSANNTTTTEGARKTSTLTYNPSTKALSTGGAVNGLTLTAATTGFTIAGGTTSKTLTVNNSYTLGAACAKAVTDNSSNADVTSSDTNLITGRTLYYQLAKKNYSTTSPGTLNTNNSTAQTASASEALSGSISLHKVAKTGTYSDLIGTPSSLPASDVSAWAKAANKPSYTLDEVGDGSTRKLSDYQPVDADLTAIAGLSGTSGLLKKTAANTWSLDTNTYYYSGNSNKSDVAWVCSTLGAGTATPTEKLEVNGGNAFLNNTGGATITLTGAARNGNNGAILFMDTYPANGQRNGFKIASEYAATQSRQNLVFYSSNNATSPYTPVWNAAMTIRYDGNIGVNSGSPTQKFYVDGNILATGTITQGSDSRIKDNQEEITSRKAFSVLENLQPKTWVWNEKSNEKLNGKAAAGLVAQEVKEILPEAVTISENGDIKDFHSLNYNTIQGYEIAAIKGLIEENKALKSEVSELKEKLNAIMEMLK